jgi:hypothetical protein
MPELVAGLADRPQPRTLPVMLEQTIRKVVVVHPVQVTTQRQIAVMAELLAVVVVGRTLDMAMPGLVPEDKYA